VEHVRLSKEYIMREQLKDMIAKLEGILVELDKVEGQLYGYKSAAVRARKVMQECRNELAELRKEVQDKKNQ
jgi:hypothetical protein